MAFRGGAKVGLGTVSAVHPNITSVHRLDGNDGTVIGVANVGGTAMLITDGGTAAFQSAERTVTTRQVRPAVSRIKSADAVDKTNVVVAVGSLLRRLSNNNKRDGV